MNSRIRKPHLGLIACFVVLLGAIWILSVSVAFEDNYHKQYNPSVKPGAVTYGTHSTVSAPIVALPPRHRTIPMICGAAVRSYAHHVHAAMPASTPAYKGLYTTSSAKVRNAGGGGAGSAMTVTSAFAHVSGSGSSSVVLPILAMASSAQTSSSSVSLSSATAPARIGGMRRMPGITGDEWEGQEETDSDGTWVWDGEAWVLSEPAIGATKIEGGNTYRWNGSSWEVISNQQDPGLPLGNTPWGWMLLLAAGYAALKMSLRDVKELKS